MTSQLQETGLLNPGASLHDLAQLTFQTDQAFRALAGRLIDRGLIERVPRPGRAVRHRLTAKGSRLREVGSYLMERVLTRSFSPLTHQQATLHRLLRQLVLETRVTSSGSHSHGGGTA